MIEAEVALTAVGTEYGETDSPESLAYRAQMNSKGSPTEVVSDGYAWAPGTELSRIKPRAAAE